MAHKDSRNFPKCWSQRLWWVMVLLAAVAAYFVLRNFELSYWQFILALGAFVFGGWVAGHHLGTWIDRRFRTERGLARQEIRICRSLHRWLRNVLDKKRARLDPAVARKLEEGVNRLAELLRYERPDRPALIEERRRLEQFLEEQLSQFKKGVIREYVESIGFAVLIALVLRAFVIEAFQIPSGSMIPSLRVGDHIFVNKLAYGVRIPLLPLKTLGLRIPAISWNWSIPERGDVIVFITPENEEEDYIKRVVAVAGDTMVVHDGQVLVNVVSFPFVNGPFFNGVAEWLVWSIGGWVPYALKDQGPFEYNDLDEDGRFRGTVAARYFEENTDGKPHPILRKSCASNRDCQLRIGTECDFSQELCIQAHYDFQRQLNDGENRFWGPYVVPADHVFCMGDNRDNSRDSRFWGPVPLEFIKGRAEFIWWSYREDRVQWDRMFTAIK